MAMRYVKWLILGVMLVAVGLGGAPLCADEPSSTLITYSTVDRLLDGELLRSVTVAEALSELAAYPAEWPVIGLGTTDWVRRNGELIVDGTAGDPNFWWVDPGYGGPVGQLVDLETAASPQGEFPFLALAVGDPATAMTWEVRDVPDVHAWLEEQLAAGGIELASVKLQGEFSAVQTSIAYNIPLTGLDLSGGYVGEDFFRFGEYVTSTWTIVGMSAADPELQPVVSTPGHPLHLHGYQPDELIGGHVGHATAISATVIVWPLTEARAGIVQPGAVRVLGELAEGAGSAGAAEAPIAHVANLLRERDVEVSVDEEGRCVAGRIPGAGAGIGLVAYVDAVDAEGGIVPVVTRGKAGEELVGEAFGEHTGAAVMLDIARRLSALPAEARPAVTLVGVVGEDAEWASAPCVDALGDTALSVLIVPTFAGPSAAVGDGPVVAFTGSAVPDWAEELIARPDAVDPQVVGDESAGTDSLQVDGIARDVPLMLIAPPLSDGGVGEMTVAVSDMEETVWLLIELLNEPAARAE